MTTEFHLTDKQKEAAIIFRKSIREILLYGGSRSAKTFFIIYAIICRALTAPYSRHAVMRFRFNHVKTFIILDTFPKVMKLAFPNVALKWDKVDWYVTLPNFSEIWFGGLDDKQRSEKILGGEYATIFPNECSQISFDSYSILKTRLAQRIERNINGEISYLPLRMYLDCNPPSRGHWTNKIFIQHKDPDSGKQINKPEDYAYLQMNPEDNKENLDPTYLDMLKNSSPRFRKRFYEGEFSDDNPNALFNDTDFDKWRVVDAMSPMPEFLRVIIGVDPSGADDTDNAINDEIGITVGALGVDGNAYLLEDLTVKAGPATWGKVATDAFERKEADLIVAERNYGGAMVGYVIKTARPNTPFKLVTATRGKSVRAEPFSALYTQGKIRHIGYFAKLEDEMLGFSTQGYIGNKSPNRADAWIWVLAELFSGIVNHEEEKQENKIESVKVGRWYR